ncbi:zinc ribbon domain-containing protein [Paraburkholderia flagellata]|uniref:zinc ribbon domain-containing protein n=1 Tax=Paraburkholderia flagellata TaxID=2883241 RepID=UPI001F316AC7|nr:zinc ribbon domain-containing protein [Paraburkholderia flagellata]
MALKKCRECGAEVSEQAKVCPKCGIQNPVKRTSLPAKIALVFLAVVVVGSVLPRLSGHGGDSSPTKTTSAATNAVPASAASTSMQGAQDTSASVTATDAPVSVSTPISLANWHYEQREDEMQKGMNKFAAVSSTNELTFGFPYSGAQHAQLALRKHVRYGKDVMLQIERGQFLCHIRSCTVTVRFDDGNGQKFTATGPSDNSSTVLFIEPFNKFYAAMVKAKRVRIEATFFHEGDRTMDFDVSDFDPKQF